MRTKDPIALLENLTTQRYYPYSPTIPSSLFPLRRRTREEASTDESNQNISYRETAHRTTHANAICDRIGSSSPQNTQT